MDAQASTPPGAGDEVEIHLLGGFSARRKGATVLTIERQPSLQLVLAYLACAAGHPLSRAQSAFTLWPDSSEQQARANLRQALYMLRTALGPALPLSADQHSLALTPAPALRVDLWDFWDAIAAGGSDPARLQRAVDLYRGALLDGQYAEWLLAARDRCEQQYHQALEQLSTFYARSHALDAAIPLARRLLASDPYQERIVRLLMQQLVRQGDRAAALAVYDQLKDLLAREMGAEPLAETTALAAAIAAQEAETPRRRLPAYLTPLFGREAEHLQLLRQLEAHDCRLITVVGPGGVGKTRLLIDVARSCREPFADGIHFVPLADVEGGEAMLFAIATALETPLGKRGDPMPQLLAFLDDKRLLLILDNLEHLHEHVGSLYAILQAASGVRMLVSSREQLHLPGEWVLRLSGLAATPVAPGASPVDAPAVQLLLYGGRAAGPAFARAPEDVALLQHMCMLLDGLPLGIELIASWAPVLTCAEMVATLEQSLGQLSARGGASAQRHDSMRAVFDSSWRLLDEDEQALLRRLAVFRGGWDRPAAAAVAAASPGRLSMLVSKSLVSWDGAGRYTMHPVIRQLAWSMLAEAEDGPATQERHCTYFLALAESAAEATHGERRAAASSQLEREHDNLRAALQRALQAADADAATRLSSSLSWFWEGRGYLSEGRQWLAASLALASQTDAGQRTPRGQAAYASALSCAGRLAWGQGEYAQAASYFEASMAIRRELDDPVGSASLLNNLAVLAQDQGDGARAIAYHHECQAIFRATGDAYRLATSLNNLGISLLGMEQADAAAATFQQSLEIRRSIDDRQGTAVTIYNLGLVALYEGDYLRARTYAEECLGMVRAIEDTWTTAYALTSLGIALIHLGAPEDAEQALAESLALLTELGDPTAVARCIDGLAGLAYVRGNPADAVRLLGAGSRLCEDLGIILPAASRTIAERLIPPLAGMDRAAWTAAWDEGRALTWAQATAPFRAR